jgi:hypothetical protein
MKSIVIVSFLLLTFRAFGQNTENRREDEFALGLKVVSGTIKYGANEFFVTDPQSISIHPGVRYDYPLKTSGSKPRRQYLSLVGQAGFLFCKAKDFDILYFAPRNPTYFTTSVGIYNRSTFSVGAELFFWKGLGNRDILGTKFISLGYNAKNFRIYASGEFYTQVINTRISGTLFSVDFFWKLITGD